MIVQKKDRESFMTLAREVGADPDDPRVANVLKRMAKTPPKPHESDKGDAATQGKGKRATEK